MWQAMAAVMPNGTMAELDTTAGQQEVCRLDLPFPSSDALGIAQRASNVIQSQRILDDPEPVIKLAAKLRNTLMRGTLRRTAWEGFVLCSITSPPLTFTSSPSSADVCTSRARLFGGYKHESCLAVTAASL